MRCPSDEVLTWLLDEELKGAARDETAEHVNDCEACQQVLERLTATPEALRSAEPSAVEACGTAFLQRLKDPSALAQLPAASDVGSPTPASSREEVVAKAAADLPTIPGYRMVEEIGRGGMGVVYLAIEEHLDRQVALKVVDTQRLPDETRLERFRAEAIATARLKHPNLIEIYDVGENNGLAYLALEYAERGSLRDRIQHDLLSWVEVAAVARTIATAVHAAHEKGFVHRDLKPANVLFTGDGVLKVSDFGLAKEIGEESGWTRTGDVIGSPSYMAPEQLAGKRAEVGPPSDVYAIGAVLYELLTGKPPFQGATTMETLLQVRERDPENPSAVRPKIPSELEAICLKCLEKDPRQRYASAIEVAEELRRFEEHEPVHASTRGWWQRLDRWRRRNAGAFRVAFAIGLVGPLLSLGVSWRLHTAERQRVAERFDRAAAEQTAAILQQAERQLALLDPVASYISVSDSISRARFADFARPIVAAQPAIAALEWVPRIPIADRKAHELQAVEEGVSDYRIQWRNDYGQFYPAEDAETYYPVLYAEPEDPNRQALGFDLGSDPDRRDAFEESLAKRRTVVTAPVRLVQDSEATPSFLAFTPVFAGAASADKLSSAAPLGFVVGVYRVSDVVSVALGRIESAGSTLSLIDEDGRQLWGIADVTTTSDDRLSSRLERSESIAVGGRTWTAVVRANDDFVQLQQSWEPTLLGLLGATVSAAVAIATVARTLKFG